MTEKTITDDLREWVVLFDQRAIRNKNGGLPSAIHFSEQMRDDIAAAAKEIHRLHDAVSTLAGNIMNARIDLATSTKAKADVALLAAEKLARASLQPQA